MMAILPAWKSLDQRQFLWRAGGGMYRPDSVEYNWPGASSPLSSRKEMRLFLSLSFMEEASWCCATTMVGV